MSFGAHMAKPSHMGRLRRIWVNRLASVLCALALMFVAFAHRPAGADTRPPSSAIAEYVALGGSLADLCLSEGGDEGDESYAECPACALTKSMVLAPAFSGPTGSIRQSITKAHWPEPLALSGHGPRAPPARGPPSIKLI